MAANKFIAKLHGKNSPDAVLELHKKGSVKPLANIPHSTPDDTPMPDVGATSVIAAQASDQWYITGGLLDKSDDVVIGVRKVVGVQKWIDAQYTFPQSASSTNVSDIIQPHSKWILRMTGDNLLGDKETIDFALKLEIAGKTIVEKDFKIFRKANAFCRDFVVDFADTTADQIKAMSGESLTLTLTCKDQSASAYLYDGACALYLYNRKLDASILDNGAMTFGDAIENIDFALSEIQRLDGQKADLSYVDATFETKTDAENSHTDLQQQINQNAGEIAELDADKTNRNIDFETPVDEHNKGATMKEIRDLETSSLTFKGYISTTEPSGIVLVQGDMWINSATLPTQFPVAVDSIKVWNGTAWESATEPYTVKNFDCWRNTANKEGYYWFGGQWMVLSTDLSTDYFMLNQTSGKWEIKKSVNLPESPTTTTQVSADSSTKIATTEFVQGHVSTLNTAITTQNTNLTKLINDGLATKANLTGGNTFTGAQTFKDYITVKDPPTTDSSTTGVSSSWVNMKVAESLTQLLPTGATIPYAGSTVPAGWLKCDGSAISRTTYKALFSAIGTTYGAGDGSSSFVLPNKRMYSGAVIGNGMSMGLMGKDTTTSESVYAAACAYQSQSTFITFSRNQTGAPLGAVWTANGVWQLPYNRVVGLADKAELSGIIVEPDESIGYIIKY